MNKNQVKKKMYVRPECVAITVEPIKLICASVTADSMTSTEESMSPWIPREIDGGTVGIGYGSTIAPAKKHTWFDDEVED
uniref:Uncharacterized protein n=1 Tax=Prevotella sp. GTC17262 TaxID=3236797 RepID=A0AB33JNI0_9BACT